MKKNKTILITGASSGIGKALAALYAAPEITLFLAGRNAVRLGEIANLCRQKGATVETTTISVTDRSAFGEKILNWDRQSPIDIVIANAGVSGGTSMDAKQTEAQLREIVADILKYARAQGAASLVKKGWHRRFDHLPRLRADAPDQRQYLPHAFSDGSG